jgi:hypothetical protein
MRTLRLALSIWISAVALAHAQGRAAPQASDAPMPPSDAAPPATAEPPAAASPEAAAVSPNGGTPEPPAAETAQPQTAPAPVAPAPPQPAVVGPTPAVAAPNPPASPPPIEEPAPRVEDRGKLLYMRFGAGVGFPFGSDVADRYDDRGASASHFSGYSFAIDLMAGSAVLPWLIVGGGAASDAIGGGTVRNSAQAERGLEHSLYYAVIGPFADVYTSPPAGLHFQALLGLARLSQAADLGHDTAIGFGTVLGVGYEFVTSKRWNLGALARLAFSPLSMHKVAGQQPSPSFYEPSLLWTATFRPER